MIFVILLNDVIVLRIIMSLSCSEVYKLFYTVNAIVFSVISFELSFIHSRYPSFGLLC